MIRAQLATWGVIVNGTFWDRLFSRKPRGMSISAWAEELKLNRENFSRWKGGVKPSEATITHLAKVLNVDRGWLHYGDPSAEGEPYTSGSFPAFTDEDE